MSNDSIEAAMLREREGYERYGRDDRAAEVDSALKAHRAAMRAQEKAVTSDVETATTDGTEQATTEAAETAVPTKRRAPAKKAAAKRAPAKKAGDA